MTEKIDIPINIDDFDYHYYLFHLIVIAILNKLPIKKNNFYN